MLVDRALGDAEKSGDFLGPVMLRDQSQAFPFALRQRIESRPAIHPDLPHRWS